MKLYFSVFLLLFSITHSAIAQTEKTDNTTDAVEQAKISVVLAAIYGSNLSYYGQTSAAAQPYFLGYGRVKFRPGIWMSAQTYKLLDSSSGMSGTNLSLGYDFNLNKKLSASLSYGRSFYPAGSQVLQSANDDMLSGGLTHDSKWFTTDLTADYSIANGGAYYTSLKLSKIIDIGLSLSDKDYFTLEPSVDVVAGTQQFFVYTEDEGAGNQSAGGGNNNSQSKPKPWEDPLGYAQEKVRGRKNGKNGNNSTVTGVLRGQNNTQQSIAVVRAPFNLLSYNVSIPLAYNRTNYTIEAAYQGSILSKAVSDSQKLQSFFNLSFYYIF